jgi:hypothetical protein
MMGKYLDIVAEALPHKFLHTVEQVMTEVAKGTSGTFATAEVQGSLVFLKAPKVPSIADFYPADELGALCDTCGSNEKWRWLDGRLLCRLCLIGGDSGEDKPRLGSQPPLPRRDPWPFPRRTR